MADDNMKINVEIVSEQIEQSFQMLHNALYMRQNQILSQLNDLVLSESDNEQMEKLGTVNQLAKEKCISQLKFFGIKMDAVLKEIREFGTISMTLVDPKFSTLEDLSLLDNFPVNESKKLKLILKNSDGDLVSERGILDPKVHIEIKNLARPQCDIVETQTPHLIELNVMLPELGEYELSVKFCESSILGSPFTLIGSEMQSINKHIMIIKPSEATNLDYLYKIGNRGIKPSDFGNPQSIIASNDRILITDSGNSCIQVFSENGEYLTCFGPKEKKAGKLLRPIDIVETSNGHYLITDYELKAVVVYDLMGNYVSSFGQRVLIGPKGICVDKSGQIIVADNKDSSLVFFKATGKFIRKIKENSKSKMKLAGPHFLVILSNSDILVTDYYHHCIKIFDKNGNYQSEFGKHGNSWGEFNYPTGICSSDKDEVIVSDWGNSRIVIFNSKFMCTRILKSIEEPLCGPQGIALNKDSSQILIVDSGNHCFKAFQYK